MAARRDRRSRSAPATTGGPSGATPAFLGVGAVCSALVAYLLAASARAVERSAGCAGWPPARPSRASGLFVLSLAGLPTMFPDRRPASSRTLDAAAARYVVWHAGARRRGGARRRRRRARRAARLAAFIGASALLLAWTAVADQPFGDLVDARRTSTPALLKLHRRAARARPGRRRHRLVARGGRHARLGRDVHDRRAGAVRRRRPRLPLRHRALLRRRGGRASRCAPASSRSRPSASMMGFVGLADKLRELQDEIEANFTAENERAAREEELAGAGRAAARAARRPDPAADLRRGAWTSRCSRSSTSPAARSSAPRRSRASPTPTAGRSRPSRPSSTPTRSELGTELELAAVRLALDVPRPPARGAVPRAQRLPRACWPATSCCELLAAHERRPLVVELTEHQQVEDYFALGRALDELRRHDIRVAIDDVGSGFSSFRHVTRVNPEILKLDRSLVCGIDDDPVRQSLAAAIVAFAADVGAVVVSEGIESEARAGVPARARRRPRPGLLPRPARISARSSARLRRAGRLSRQPTIGSVRSSASSDSASCMRPVTSS